MKTLLLIRHAKSDWSNDGLLDIDRPLNNRGYADAYTMSKLFKETKILPDLIISSSAIRAISTALIISRNLNYNPSAILINSSLYESTTNKYSKVVEKIDSGYKCVLLFGHNPVISDFAMNLGHPLKTEMVTCAVATINKEVKNWTQFISAKTETCDYNFPKHQL